MSVHVPYRSFSRSQKARVGGANVGTTVSSFVNIDSPRNQRDLGHHVAVGGLTQAGAPLVYTSNGYLTDGARVSKTAVGSLNLTVSAGYFTRNDGTTGSNNATTTLAVGTGVANPRLDLVCIDTAGSAFVVIAGTATAGANVNNRLGLPAEPLAANRIPVAIIVKGSAANLDADTIVELR